MSHARPAWVRLAKNNAAGVAALLFFLHKGHFHPVVISPATSEATIRGIRRKRDCRRLCFLCALCALHSASSVFNLFPSLRLKPTLLGCALHAARHAAACASPPAAIPPRSSPRAQSAFHPNRQTPGSAHSEQDSARTSTAPARTALPAL